MTENQRDNVHEYRRERLEPEIAAMSVEIDEDENPIVIVNIDDPAAKKAIKRVIVWLGGITGLAWLREWASQSAQRQIALAVASTAAAGIAATAVMTDVTRHEADPTPPATAERVITLPPHPPVTITAVLSTPASKPSRRRAPAEQADGEDDPPPSTAPPPRLVATPRPSPTADPTTSPRAHATEPTAPPKTSDRGGRHSDADQPGRSTAPPTTTPPSPQPAAQPEPTPEPTVAAAEDCDGLVEVDLDPLLDLCLLG
ncbi:hypothetical protein ACIBQ6_21760 [Nonomuraea sp. NPDC049655]|uniref:hypothetical protein n=1 Tax=Nonomuraea sp. NPDC049655 TaxID=3364355 RepID=UPI00379B0724